MDKRASGVKAQTLLGLRTQVPFRFKGTDPLRFTGEGGREARGPGDVDNSIIYGIKTKKLTLL